MFLLWLFLESISDWLILCNRRKCSPLHFCPICSYDCSYHCEWIIRTQTSVNGNYLVPSLSLFYAGFSYLRLKWLFYCEYMPHLNLFLITMFSPRQLSSAWNVSCPSTNDSFVLQDHLTASCKQLMSLISPRSFELLKQNHEFSCVVFVNSFVYLRFCLSRLHTYVYTVFSHLWSFF